MIRALKWLAATLLILVLALLVAGGGWLYWRVRVSFPQQVGSLRVPGLAARVEVLRDARGVPHLRAQSLEDLLFAQGYVTAQDRLWQMDLSRRAAQGQLSEIFGEAALSFDIENRTLGFNHAVEREAKALDPEVGKLFEAYARGVNAFIDSHRDRLPIEFLLLRYRPRAWRVADSLGIPLNMAKVLSNSWPDELMRERIHVKLKETLYANLFPDHSPLDHPVAEWPTAPLPSQANPAPRPSTELIAPTVLASVGWNLLAAEGLEPLPSALESLLEESVTFQPAGLGSNNWVVAGTHTKSGKPLLANDPHLDHSIPSVWYMVDLKAPGFDVTGVSLPGLPGVVIGHNDHIAWGMTNTGTDVQDLYIESFNFRDPKKYLHNAEWVDGEVREETIKVRNAHNYSFAVKSTRHGPIISHQGDRDLALGWTALQPGALSAVSRALFRLDQAHNWEGFTAALRDFSGPMQNFVYADVDGNIGYYAAGWVPIRKKGEGTLPVPGSIDDYDWAGQVPFEDLPHSYNPAIGMIATANGRVVPDNYPYLITTRWEAPYRTARIFQLLEAGSAFTVADLLRIQMDIHPLDDEWLAKQLVAAAAQHSPRDPEAQYALGLLSRWDGEARADSAATLVCEVTRAALLERVLEPKLGDDLSGYHWPMSTVFLQNAVTNNWTWWLPPGDVTFNDTLIASLEEAVKRLPRIVGSNSHEAWRWGNTIPLTFHHPLSYGIPWLGRVLDVGPFPQRGTLTTVKSTTMTLGPSMRMVVDFSNLDGSVQNITLGESGQVFSPYYMDQVGAWLAGTSFPMLFSDAAVQKGAIHRLVLEPAR